MEVWEGEGVTGQPRSALSQCQFCFFLEYLTFGFDVEVGVDDKVEPTCHQGRGRSPREWSEVSSCIPLSELINI